MLALCPGMYWRQNTGVATYGKRHDGNGVRHVRFGIKGQADYTGVAANGIRVEIEIKTTGKKQSAQQKIFELAIINCNAYYFLIDSVDAIVEMCIFLRSLNGTKG